MEAMDATMGTQDLEQEYFKFIISKSLGIIMIGG